MLNRLNLSVRKPRFFKLQYIDTYFFTVFQDVKYIIGCFNLVSLICRLFPLTPITNRYPALEQMIYTTQL